MAHGIKLGIQRVKIVLGHFLSHLLPIRCSFMSSSYPTLYTSPVPDSAVQSITYIRLIIAAVNVKVK